MTWLKLKFAIAAASVAVLASGVVTVAVSQVADDTKLSAQEIAKKSEAAYAALSSYSSTGTAISETPGTTLQSTFEMRLQRPNLYRVRWTKTGGLYTSKGSVWSEGAGNFYVMGAAGQEQNMQPERMSDPRMTFAAANGVSSGVAATIPKTFFGLGEQLKIAASGRIKTTREADEKINGVNCFVLAISLDSIKLPGDTGDTGKSTTTLWIGKKDSLIHQTRMVTEGSSFAPPVMSDKSIKTILGRQNKAATPEAMAALRAEIEATSKKVQGRKTIFTQTHESISVNKKFSPKDFAR